jgi:hypothetical protein
MTRKEREIRADVIEALLMQRRRSIRWLAKSIGANHESVRQWLKGDASPRDADAWDRMLSALGVSSATPDVRVLRTGLRVIPVYPGLSAGQGSSDYTDVDWIEIKDWGGHFERWGRIITGCSMEPELMPGDVVVFENRLAEPGHVVHAFDAGQDCVKVLRGQGETALLVPINPEFHAIDARGWTVKGVAVMRIRKGEHGRVTTDEFPHGMRHRF